MQLNQRESEASSMHNRVMEQDLELQEMQKDVCQHEKMTQLLQCANNDIVRRSLFTI